MLKMNLSVNFLVFTYMCLLRVDKKQKRTTNCSKIHIIHCMNQCNSTSIATCRLLDSKDKARPLVKVTALRSLQCFDTDAWVTGGHPACKIPFHQLQTFSAGQAEDTARNWLIWFTWKKQQLKGRSSSNIHNKCCTWWIFIVSFFYIANQ